MKFKSILVACLVSIVFPFAHAQQAAPVTLTIHSYQTLASTLSNVLNAVSPGAGTDAIDGFREALGIQDLEGIDTTRPWQIALWTEGLTTGPALSIRIPVSNFASFRAGLQPGLLRDGWGQPGSIEPIGQYARIWIQTGSTSETTRAAEKAWLPESIPAVEGVFNLTFQPTPALRNELLQGLAMGRTAIAMGIAGMADQAPDGLDVNSVAQILNLYLDLLETGLRGLDSFELQLHPLVNERITIRSVVTSSANSDLAAWFQPVKGNLQALAPYLDPAAPVALAMRLDDNPAFAPTLKRLVSLSIEMQGLDPDSNTARQTEELVNSLLPMQFGTQLTLGKAIEFNAVYQFLDRDPAAVLDLIDQHMKILARNEVGPDKIYTAVTLQPAYRKAHDLDIHRATFVLNLDAPIYQAPGQKEVIEQFWPGGAMTFDYARQGNNLLVGSLASLDALLARASSPVATSTRHADLASSTVAFGHFNPISLISVMLAGNPMVPEHDQQRFARLNPKNADISFRVDLDGRFSSSATIPMALLRALSELDQ